MSNQNEGLSFPNNHLLEVLAYLYIYDKTALKHLKTVQFDYNRIVSSNSPKHNFSKIYYHHRNQRTDFQRY